MVYCSGPSPKQRRQRRLRLSIEPIRQYLGVSEFAECMVVDAHGRCRTASPSMPARCLVLSDDRPGHRLRRQPADVANRTTTTSMDPHRP
ncbi:hypothetical protein [Streptomyces plumbiresistens]|uniref:Uncharacterized protein n=1 Tax=Streptomyces plumbiresistens TaxID=511811 RepID=A0ABP7TZF3_9ACTN